MQPTFIGIAQIAIGLLLVLFGSIPATLAFVLLSGLMGGSAALLLPALGGSSIPPIQLAMLFLVLRLARDAKAQWHFVRPAGRDVALLALFVAYGVLMAYVGPRLFAYQIDVTPMRVRTLATRYTNITAFIYSAFPLQPTSQNITTAVYLLGTLVLAFVAHVTLSNPRARDTLVKTAVAIGFLHAFLGVFALAARGTAIDGVLQLFRNGAYAQLEHSYNGFARMTGIWPEASGYGTYGLVWMVFLTECALRGIRPRATAAAALSLAAVLVLSTSTTAYFGVVVYLVLLGLRLLLFPQSIAFRSVLALAAVGFAAVILVLALMASSPTLATEIGDLLRHFTVDKGDSLSGKQRTFWAAQGLEAFVRSYGLGIGPGSFRSSSIATAILGATGIVGTIGFFGFVLRLWQPWRRSTWAARAPEPTAIASAAAWACVVLVTVQSISAPTPDPGPDFAVLAGAALALRRMRVMALPHFVPFARAPQPQVTAAV